MNVHQDQAEGLFLEREGLYPVIKIDMSVSASISDYHDLHREVIAHLPQNKNVYK